MSASLLFGEYRNRILALLMLNSDVSYHVREISRLTDTFPGTLNKELAKLEQMGILKSKRVGNQVQYSADTTCPFYEELASIVRKTFGLSDVLAQALQPLTDRLKVAFVFGSAATGSQTNTSDIDLMLIGDIQFTDAVEVLYPTQGLVHREINPVVYSLEEWKRRLNENDPFVKDLLDKPKLMIKGGEDELR